MSSGARTIAEMNLSSRFSLKAARIFNSRYCGLVMYMVLLMYCSFAANALFSPPAKIAVSSGRPSPPLCSLGGGEVPASPAASCLMIFIYTARVTGFYCLYGVATEFGKNSTLTVLAGAQWSKNCQVRFYDCFAAKSINS
jgi:hypothetical protein